MAKTISTGPKDVFLHLILIVTLFLSVISILTLAFEYINLKFPDDLNTYWVGSLDAIRWSSSMLIVSFPIFLLISSFIRKDLLKNPAKKEYRVRKWLIFFTLFVAAITILVDLIMLVNEFYGGELTTRFLLKAFSVLVITGIVFGYYLWDVNQAKVKVGVSNVFAVLSAALVVSALVGGFFLVGSPSQQRLVRLDEQRMNDLQNIQYEVVNYYQQTAKLPENLDTLKDPLRGYIAPVDPVTDASYEYKKVADLQFELCATFARPSLVRPTGKTRPMDPYGNGVDTNWTHETGRTCFTRTIDPARVKPFEKPLPY